MPDHNLVRLSDAARDGVEITAEHDAPIAIVVGAQQDTGRGELVPQPHGGALRRGNPANKGNRSRLARDILAARTPEAARDLIMAAFHGRMVAPGAQRKGRSGQADQYVTVPIAERLKAYQAILDRGGVPVRAEVAGTGIRLEVVAGPPAELDAPTRDLPQR